MSEGPGHQKGLQRKMGLNNQEEGTWDSQEIGRPHIPPTSNMLSKTGLKSKGFHLTIQLPIQGGFSMPAVCLAMGMHLSLRAFLMFLSLFPWASSLNVLILSLSVKLTSFYMTSRVRQLN